MAMREITGRKVFIFTASAFGLIIAVNLTMAYNAVSTFPGLETRNSYESSQNFQRDYDAQTALGWEIETELKEGELHLSITGKDGEPVEVSELNATLGRATHVQDDKTPAFEFRDGVYVAPAELSKGNWNLRMAAIAEDGTPFRQRVVIHVR